LKGLKFVENAFVLYILKDRFIAYFESFEAAARFARKYYPNIESHVEPISIYTFEDVEE